MPQEPKLNPAQRDEIVVRLAAFKSARTVRAKTGTLASVVTLAGYILGPSPLAFAFLLNGVGGKVSESRRRIDMAVAKIAS